MNKLVAALCVAALVGAAPHLAWAGSVNPPPTLKNIPSLGYQMRTQGWNPIGSFGHTLSQDGAATIGAAFTGAFNGGTSVFTEIPSATVPRIRIVWANFYGNAVPTSEIPALNDIYVKARVWNSAYTGYRDARFSGDALGKVSSKSVLISDDITFATTQNADFDILEWVGTTGATLSIPRGPAPIRTQIVPTTREGATGEDATAFTTAHASSNSSQTYAHSFVLGYTGTSPVKSLWCAGDSIIAGTGDGAGQRPSAGGWCLRIANNTTSPNVQYVNGITPNFGVGMGAESGDTLADFVSANGSSTRLLMASFFSTVLTDMGTNDLGGTLSTIKANKLTEACLYASNGSTVIATTLLPKTTSTDGWTTAANQTVTASESNRVGYNDWMRDGSASGFVRQAAAQCNLPSSMFEVYDAAAAVEVNASNVLTLDGGFWQAPVSQSAAYSGSVTSSPTSSSFTDSALTPTTANAYRGYAIRFTSGTCSGKVAAIQYQSTTSLNTAGFGCTPATNDSYQIWQAIETQDGIHPTSYGHAQLAADLVNNHIALVK